MPHNHRLVFLGGFHRSGKTLLAERLAEHADVSVLTGTGASSDEGQYLQSVYFPDHVHGGPGRFALDRAARLTESSKLVTPANAERLFATWAPFWDLSRPVLLEVSAPNLIRTRFLQALFPAASFIVITRHPVAVTLETARWRTGHQLFAEDRKRLARVHVLTYEELVRDAQPTLARLCAALGLDPAPPTAPLETGWNERHFEAWRALKEDPVMRTYLACTRILYEHRVMRFGYSLGALERHEDSIQAQRSYQSVAGSKLGA
jgi:Sulfotransferase family